MSLFYTFSHFAQRHTVDASYIEELNVLLHVTSQLLSEWAALAPREDWWRWRVGGEVLGVNSYKQCVSVVQIWGKIDEFYRAELKLVLLVVLKMAVASRLTLCGNCSYSQTQGTPRASLLYCHSSGFLLLNCFTPPVPVLRLLTPALGFFFLSPYLCVHFLAFSPCLLFLPVWLVHMRHPLSLYFFFTSVHAVTKIHGTGTVLHEAICAPSCVFYESTRFLD